MATVTVQSLLNTAVYDSYTVDVTVSGDTVGDLKDAVESATGVSVDWFDLVLDEQLLTVGDTLYTAGVVDGSSLRTHNKISRLATREDRQKAKLDLAALDRTASSNPRDVYDITELPTQYSGNTVVDNPNVGGLVEGRPWDTT